MSDFTFALSGEIDIASSPELLTDLRRVIHAGATDVTVDCTNLTFIDSTGVLVLLAAQKTLEWYGRRMRIVNLASGPRRVFEILDLIEVFGIDSLVSH